jgi:hypothetical protein
MRGNTPGGPFVADSSSQAVSGSTTYTLAGRRGRYILVWITNLGGNTSVHVNEVKATG